MSKRKAAGLLLALSVAASSVASVIPDSGAAAADKLPAFPGAEGGGMWTTGARASSSPTIYHVTNLKESGTGSFADAVSKGNRIIVFDVAGNINLTKKLTISKDNLTILGQTAPGSGICIKGAPVYISGSNVILRYMRFRMGTENNIDDDSFGAGSNASNLMIDHCSMSWSTDECCSIYAVKDVSVQWCLISEPLNQSLHDEGDGVQEHGYGGIWGGVNASFHHNLMMSGKSRFPRIGTSETVRSYNGGADTLSLIDVRNNVIYNWRDNQSYGGENGTRINLVNNYYREGPASKQINRFFQMTAGSKAGTSQWGPDLALSGNYYDSRSSSSNVAEINADNTKGVLTKDNKKYNLIAYSDTDSSHAQYIKDYPITTQTAQEVYELVLADAGASFARDSVDERVVNDVRNRTADKGTNGIINFVIDTGEGWPELTGVKLTDTDNDGIPDDWEDVHGLNRNSASDALTKAASGYYYIEEYANDLVSNGEPSPTLAPTATPAPTPTPDPNATPTPVPTDAPITDLPSELEPVTESRTWTFGGFLSKGTLETNAYSNGLAMYASSEKNLRFIETYIPNYPAVLNLPGKGSTEQRSVAFLPGADGKVEITAAHGGSGTARTLVVKSTSEVKTTLTEGAAPKTIWADASANTPVYIYSAGSGINIYEIKFIPNVQPTQQPTSEPTAEPTIEPTAEPTKQPTQQPTSEPTAEPTTEPTKQPTQQPTAEPTVEPTTEPTKQPTQQPTLEPTAEPTTEPTIEPTTKPTPEPVTEITAITSSDEGVTVELTFGDNFEEAICFAAVYDSTGRLTMIRAVDAASSEKAITFKGVTVPDGSIVSAYLWNKNTGEPMCIKKTV